MSTTPAHASRNPGEAWKLRSTAEGRAKLRTDKQAQLDYFRRVGDAARAAECERELEALA